MRWLTWTTGSLLALALVWAPAMAQQDLDSTKADAQHHKVEFENDQVRVVRWQLPAGEATTKHSHPDTVNVFLTDGSLQITTDDGKSNTVQAKAGDAAWRPAVTHVAKNVGDKPVEGILVEPKNPHSSRPAGSADETTFPGGRSKVLFENEKVRVVRYRFEPGDKNEMHGHPDNVQILLTDSKATVTTADGKTTPSQGKAKGSTGGRPLSTRCRTLAIKPSKESW